MADNCVIEHCDHFKTRNLLLGNCLRSISNWRKRSNSFNEHGTVIDSGLVASSRVADMEYRMGIGAGTPARISDLIESGKSPCALH